MPHYMTRFSFSPETWAKLIHAPEDRRTAVAALAEAAGGTLEGYWYAFGDQDGYALFEFPDNVAASAVLMAVAASGATSVSTTPLLTVEEAVEAMDRAGHVRYSTPGG